MVDTFTDKVRLRKPEVNAKEDLWGPPVSDGLNDGVADMIDQAMAQITDVDVTGGNVVLTASSGVSDTQRPMFLRIVSRFVLAEPFSGSYETTDDP